MPIDPNKALGHVLDELDSSWGQDDVILYHLGIGAGRDPVDPGELPYVYENAGLKVVPSFGVIPVFDSILGLLGTPGIDINPMMVLHGEQDLVLHRPIPTSAEVTSQARIAEIWDKGKGALVELEVVTRDRSSDEPLFTNRFGVFVRGEGGFGGEPGPAPGNIPPGRDPDHVIERRTETWQALLYRLSGDRNPLHADPNMAKMAGYDRPILHGLCTFGIACKAVVDEVFDGDVTAVERYQVRFSSPVLPGETVVVRTWDEGDTILIEASVAERDVTVLKNAAITRRTPDE